MKNNNLIHIQSALNINLSHYLFTDSPFKTSISREYQELYFYFYKPNAENCYHLIFTVFEENNTFELLPTDNNKNVIPAFKTSDIESMIYYITNKFNQN
jgi:hypothetical protein